MKAITWFFSAAICIALAFMFFACSSDSGGDSGSTSNASSSSVGNGTLSPPANVAATVNSANSITVSWSAVAGAAEYYVYRSTSPTDSYALVGSSTATSYTDNNLSAATTYYYRVASHGSTGTGSQSGFVSATTQPGGDAPSSSSAEVLDLIENPDPPTGVTTSTNSTSSISIGWGAVSGATGYYVYRSESTTGVYVQIGSSTATSYTDNGLPSGTTYYYRVSGYNSGGTGSQSSFVSGTTHSNAPAGVTAAANSANGITVSWSASAGAINYRIYRSESGDADTYALAGTSSATSYANTGLTMATKYYYRVAAYNAGGEGPMSEAVSETTLPFVPTNVTAAVNSPTSITVSWSAVTGASNYRVYRSTSVNGTYTLVNSPSGTSYTNTGLTTGTTYYYRVAAYSSTNGEGPQSEAVFETPRTTPSVPQSFTATPGNGQVVLSWIAPSNHGGSEITGYQVSSNNGSTWVAASGSTSHTFTGLANGTSYTFKVRAVNAAGNGAEASVAATPRNYYGSPVIYEGKTYRTVVIGTHTWMAENLNYNASGSVCYNNNNANCNTYGRLYDWNTALTICPSGWHLPTDAEWTVLTDYIGGSSTAGTNLKAASGWNTGSGYRPGTDSFGFAALPGGYGYSDGYFDGAGNYGNWWSASESGANIAYIRTMYYNYEVVGTNSSGMAVLFSVRCLQDSAP